ncbi:MAG TPA: hypothetical protein VMZ24_05070 [Patescibacteria group bacterium]|jgi:hypothetical protein|nr:hypothetical protein [Patescibacteria group bacterium]
MDYGMIGKIEKGKLYAEERDRFTFNSFEVQIQGDNNTHVVKYNQGIWNCDCDFFSTRAVCGHTMAMERVLQDMVQLA